MLLTFIRLVKRLKYASDGGYAYRMQATNVKVSI
jgi:hypothetical protein